MAGERIHTCRYAEFPAGTAIDGVTHAAIIPTTTRSIDPGAAGSPGPAETLVTDSGVDVVLYGMDYAALLALVGAPKQTLVLGIKGLAGANEKISVKSVYFDSVPAQVDLKAKDTGGTVPRFAVRGTAQWLAGETFADIITATADA